MLCLGVFFARQANKNDRFQEAESVAVRIGKYEFCHGLMLAPMAGYSDRAMRVLCNNMGAEWSVTEMVSAKATVFGDKKTSLLARIRADEGKVALQIFGSDPETMARAAEILSSPIGDDGAMPMAIDINMGCPVNKIFSNGEGHQALFEFLF